MSEKRFEVIDDSFSKWIVDTTLKEDKHEGAIYTAYDMCRKLNELFEENEQLRQSIKELQRSREYWIQDNNRLTKKNNELIAKIDFLERVIDGDV